MDISNNIITLILGDSFDYINKTNKNFNLFQDNEVIPLDSCKLENGSIIGEKDYIGARHSEEILNLCSNLNLDCESRNLYEQLLFLSKNNIATIANIGNTDGKKNAIVFMPEKLSLYQIECLEKLKNMFEDKYCTIKTYLYSTVELRYKGNVKDLEKENILDNLNFTDVETLYNEIYRQKESFIRKIY